MKIRIIGLAIVLAALVVGVQLAFADNGPHGGYTATTDACAGCHRTHTAPYGDLLVDSVPSLCFTCHGANATGANTDVQNGVYDNSGPIGGQGRLNGGLKAGGFVNAIMDTQWISSSSILSTTSSHLYDGSVGTIWGIGAIGSGAGTTTTLDCASCHNPHGRAGTGGTPTYRILRMLPYGGTPNPITSTGYLVADQATKDYTVLDTNNKYYDWPTGVNNYVAPTRKAMDIWCSQCHTRYRAPYDAGHVDSGDPIFIYRHRTQSSNPASTTWGCVRCHVAHGTSATMGQNSGGVAWPDGGTSPSGNARSSLLRVDNRGVCELCHRK